MYESRPKIGSRRLNNSATSSIVSRLARCTIVVIAAVATSAHHSHSSLDRNNIQTHRGTVTKYDWRMPHVFIKVLAPNAAGKVVEYSIEVLHPPAMIERGWSKTSLKPGDQITWQGAADKGRPHYQPPSDWPYTKIAQELVDNFDESQNPQVSCKNPGPPKATLLPYPMKIERPNEQTIIFDYELRERQRTIYLDRDHPAGEPSAMGHSVGWFEGDVLVIETNNFIADRWGSHTGVDSSDQKHLVERVSISDDGLALEFQMTLTDPEYLTEPVTIDYYMAKIADRELIDVGCTLENARLYLEAGMSGGE